MIIIIDCLSLAAGWKHREKPTGGSFSSKSHFRAIIITNGSLLGGSDGAANESTSIIAIIIVIMAVLFVCLRPDSAAYQYLISRWTISVAKVSAGRRKLWPKLKLEEPICYQVNDGQELSSAGLFATHRSPSSAQVSAGPLHPLPAQTADHQASHAHRRGLPAGTCCAGRLD